MERQERERKERREGRRKREGGMNKGEQTRRKNIKRELSRIWDPA